MLVYVSVCFPKEESHYLEGQVGDQASNLVATE